MTHTINLTVPVFVNGCFAFEFEAAVDVNVTYPGCPAQLSGPPERCWPAEGPEWDVTAHYVDCGNSKAGYMLQPAPKWLAEQIDAYLESREGDDWMLDKVAEAVSEARYEMA